MLRLTKTTSSCDAYACMHGYAAINPCKRLLIMRSSVQSLLPPPKRLTHLLSSTLTRLVVLRKPALPSALLRTSEMMMISLSSPAHDSKSQVPASALAI